MSKVVSIFHLPKLIHYSDESLIIKNNGLSNLYLNNIYSLDNSFSINPTYLNIAPQDSQEILISFSPLSSIPYYSELIVNNQDPNVDEISISLQGQGIPSQIQILELFTSNIDFPPTSIGDTSMINLPVFNSGSEKLIF